MPEQSSILGWRKLSAWTLVFGLCAYATIAVIEAGGTDIPDNVLAAIKWVTGFFFGANAAIHIAKSLGITVVKE